MIGQFDYSEKGWVSGTGRKAVWREIDWQDKPLEPQFLQARPVFLNALKHNRILEEKQIRGDEAAAALAQQLLDPTFFAAWHLENVFRVAFMDVSSSTNTRTMISAVVGENPSGNKTPLLQTAMAARLPLAGLLNSLPYDYQFRNRLAGTTLNYFIVAESALPRPDTHYGFSALTCLTRSLNCPGAKQAPWWIQTRTPVDAPWRRHWAVTVHERMRLRAICDAIAGSLFSFTETDFRLAVRDCDIPQSSISKDDITATLHPKGLWRVDKDSRPEHRLTILALVAFIDLNREIARVGNINEAIQSFMTQNNGEGWQLPETLRLADYGLGHDDRALEHQQVRAHFGPRFYDWQLEQSPEESWQECHLHTRNLLGPAGYQALLDELEGCTPDVSQASSQIRSPQLSQRQLFDE